MPNKTEFITMIGGLAAGWKLAELFAENNELPHYDSDTKEIYEELIQHYRAQINNQIPLQWHVKSEMVGKEQKTRPLRTANDLNTAIISYNETIAMLEEFTEDVVFEHYGNILKCIVDLLESVLERYSKEHSWGLWLSSWVYGSESYKEYYKHNIPRLDGPEIMFFTEIAESILMGLNENIDYEKINNRKIYCESISKCKMSNHHRHTTFNHKVAITLDLILDHYTSISEAVYLREENKDIPQSINDMLRSINFINKMVLHLIYRCMEGSKRDFDIDEFIKGVTKESEHSTNHLLGGILLESLKTTGINNIFSVKKFTKQTLDWMLANNLKTYEISSGCFNNQNSSGIRQFFDTPPKQLKIFNSTIHILQDVFRLYFYSKRLEIIQNALITLGINIMVTHEGTKNSIETQLEITKKTFTRLINQVEVYINDYKIAIDEHHKYKKKYLNDPIYQNTHRAIIQFNENVLQDKKMIELFESSKIKINTLIQYKNNNPSQITQETKDILIMWFSGVLDSITLESGLSTEDYTSVRETLEKALVNLTNKQSLEPSQPISAFIQEILNLLIANSNETTENDMGTIETFEENHTWRSPVLKEIYDNATWQYQATKENCINYYKKLKKVLYLIETKQAIGSIGLYSLEIILRKFVKKNEKDCYPKLPMHHQPLQALVFNVKEQEVNISLDEENYTLPLRDEHTNELLELLPDEITLQLTEIDHRRLLSEKNILVHELALTNEKIIQLEEATTGISCQ